MSFQAHAPVRAKAGSSPHGNACGDTKRTYLCNLGPKTDKQLQASTTHETMKIAMKVRPFIKVFIHSSRFGGCVVNLVASRPRTIIGPTVWKEDKDT